MEKSVICTFGVRVQESKHSQHAGQQGAVSGLRIQKKARWTGVRESMLTFVAGIWEKDGKKEKPVMLLWVRIQRCEQVSQWEDLQAPASGKGGATRTTSHEGDDYSSHILSTSATELGDCSLPKGQSPDKVIDRSNWIGSSGRRH